MKLDVVIVVASIARENVALTTLPMATPVAPDAGDVDVTVGAGGGPVVKLQVTADASACPSVDLIAVVSFAV